MTIIIKNMKDKFKNCKNCKILFTKENINIETTFCNICLKNKINKLIKLNFNIQEISFRLGIEVDKTEKIFTSLNILI